MTNFLQDLNKEKQDIINTEGIFLSISKLGLRKNVNPDLFAHNCFQLIEKRIIKPVEILGDFFPLDTRFTEEDAINKIPKEKNGVSVFIGKDTYRVMASVFEHFSKYGLDFDINKYISNKNFILFTNLYNKYLSERFKEFILNFIKNRQEHQHIMIFQEEENELTNFLENHAFINKTGDIYYELP